MLSEDWGDRLSVAVSLENLARVADAQAQNVAGVQRAIRLVGAAVAVREAIATVLLPGDDPLYDGALAALRAQVDGVTWRRLWAEGRAMSVEEAIAYACDGGPVDA